MLQVDGGLEVIGRLFTANEGFRGQIRDDQMEQYIAEVRMHPNRCKSTYLVSLYTQGDQVRGDADHDLMPDLEVSTIEVMSSARGSTNGELVACEQPLIIFILWPLRPCTGCLDIPSSSSHERSGVLVKLHRGV